MASLALETGRSNSPARLWTLPARGVAVFHGCPQVYRLSHYFLPRVLRESKRLLYLDGANRFDPLLLSILARHNGFYDLLQTPTTQAMKKLSFKDSPAELEAESARTLEILKNSPYRSQLGTAALFLQQLREESKLLPRLIGPHLGNRIYPITALMNSGPELRPEKIDQVAALPMGSRIKLDPWNDEIEMLKTRPVALQSAREKMPFEITPFMPYLTRYKELHAAVDSARGNVAAGNQAPRPPEN